MKMMMNLFSIFDPSSSHLTSLNWLSTFIFALFLPPQFWIVPSRLMLSWNYLLTYLFKEFYLMSQHHYSNLIILISTTMLIFFNNFLGLFPYIFTSSSHMSFSLSLSLSLWISMMLFSMFNYLNSLLAHLTPLGTPTFLMPFMVIIESISLLIRPITLSIRLTANMIAGHLLLSLLGSSSPSLNTPMSMIPFLLLIISQIMLFTLEISVSLIQAYVFSTLATLYSSEI